MNQETRNCPLRLTQKCVSTCTVPWNISPQALLWEIKLETGNCSPVSQIWRCQHRWNLNAGLKEVSLALMLIHICTIYSPQFVFLPLFLTSRLIQRTGCKTEADNVYSHNTRKLCQQIFDKCTNNLLATTPLHRFLEQGSLQPPLQTKTRIQPTAISNRQNL